MTANPDGQVSRRVVIVGTVDPVVESGLKSRGAHVLVANDVRHALLLQRMFQPHALLFTRVPSGIELGLLAAAATRPVVVIAGVTATAPAAVDLVRQGVSRVLPAGSPPGVLDQVLDLPLARERPVGRALAQLAIFKATGTLQVGPGNPPAGVVVVDNGVVSAVDAGGRTGNEALAALAQLEAPLAVRFEERRADEAAGFDIDVAPTGEFSLYELEGDDVEFTDPGPAAPASDEELHNLGRPTCLVVEDDVDLARLYMLTLKNRGFDVEVRHDGDVGFEAALARPPDVILSDIMMPRVSGWDLLGLVRNHARLRETPFLILSHHREMVQKLQMANGGADAYLEKSLRPDAIAAAVTAAVNGRRDVEARLLGGAERVDGELFGLGPQTLLRMCQRQRLTGRLAVRPQQQRFLITLQDGDVVDAQGSMGTQALRHRDAVRALLLVDDGPFTFVRGRAPATAPRTPLLPLLDELCAELEQLLDDLRTGALLNGHPLQVRRELLDVYRSTAPEAAWPILDQLEAGRPPRDLIAAGTVDLVLIDSVVRDLFRKGVIAP